MYTLSDVHLACFVYAFFDLFDYDCDLYDTTDIFGRISSKRFSNFDGETMDNVFKQVACFKVCFV